MAEIRLSRDDVHLDASQSLADAAAHGESTLLSSSRDREHNYAVVLRG